MPDITMCMDNNCQSRFQCYRYMADPTPHRQSYFKNSPKDDPLEDKCHYFMGIAPSDGQLRKS
jgi:hypothetical protein